MTVGELIAFLETQPKDRDICYRIYSEMALLEAKDISVEDHGLPRPDGWIHYYRDDMFSQTYVVLPGN